MFAVIFVVHPKDGHKDEYLGLAKELKPILEGIDGFIDNERFASQRTEGDILSLSTWRDEKVRIISAWDAPRQSKMDYLAEMRRRYGRIDDSEV